MKKNRPFNLSNTKKLIAFACYGICILFTNSAKAQFAGYNMVNYINNVVQFPANFAPATTSSITDTLLTTCWYNIGYPAGAGILHMTWDTPFFNGPGDDVLIAIWNDNASGGANVRFQLSDNSYTSSVFVDFVSGLITSSGGAIAPVGYNTITNSITAYSNTPHAKLLNISDFYNGALAIKGIEFSGFTVSQLDLLAISATQNATPLPLLLSKFECADVAGSPHLTWQTSTEINTSHFELQRSADGISFTKITEMSAAGNSNEVQQYQYTDLSVKDIENKMYYRLKMVDIDQQFIYSDICTYHKAQRFESTQPFVIQNPAKNEIILQGGKLGSIFMLSNVAGKVIKNGIIKSPQTLIEADLLPNGIYILHFEGNKYPQLKVTIAH